MADTFNLVGLVPFAHDETQKPMDEIYEYTNRSEEEVDYALCEFSRPKGNYERIFPVKNHIEKSFCQHSFSNLSTTNEKSFELISSYENINKITNNMYIKNTSLVKNFAWTNNNELIAQLKPQ